MNFRRILSLSPHTDDTELGCGGTISRLIDHGADVFVAVFSLCEESLPPGAPADTLQQECLTALERLGVPRSNAIFRPFPVRRLAAYRQEILEELVRLRRELNPDLILLPAGCDLHQDHQTIHTEGLRAFKERTVLGYELPWNHINFAAQAFISLERSHVGAKVEALQAYRTQRELARNYFSPDFVEGLARVRGTQVRTEWAEAFEVGRIKW